MARVPCLYQKWVDYGDYIYLAVAVFLVVAVV